MTTSSPNRLLSGAGFVVLAIAVIAVLGATVLVGGWVSHNIKPSATPTPSANIGNTTPGVTILPAFPTPALSNASLAVVDCSIRSALGPGAPAPSLVMAQVPVTAQLNAYWAHGMAILAPAGWTCQVDVGQDGSWSGSVANQGETNLVRFTVYPGAPALSMADLACPLFPAAAAFMAGQNEPCSVDEPVGELDSVLLGPTSVRFEDQPGAIGVGEDSGGPLRAIGALVYDPGKIGAQLTCLLPEDAGDVCDAISLDFATRLTP